MAYISFQPKDYFNTILNTGDGTTNKSFTGVGFQPDLVWNKIRSTTYSHWLYDAVRGAGAEKEISSNTTTAEGGNDNQIYGYISSFDSDGFSVTGNTNSAYFNQNNETFVNWCWKANGAGSSNTDGTLTSTVSANTTSGFSIGTYTSDITSAGYKTVGHGLGKKPKIIITKNLGVAGQRWGVQAPGILTGDSYILELNATSAEDNQSGNGSLATVNSNVFSVNWAEGLGNANSGGNYVFYAFTDIKGYSAMGSYTGNGNADGTFVYTGFKPAFVLSKMSSGVQGWFLIDNKRANPYNPVDGSLHPNSTAAEDTASDFFVDFTSNGFKLRDNDAQLNGSGSTYIYMAFAEHPLVSSNDIPATAR